MRRGRETAALPARPGDVDLAVLPSVRWAGPTHIDLTAEIPPGGLFLGTDRSGQPAAVAAVQPRPVRIGLLGHPALAAALAYRLLGVGCQVTVLTAGSPYWTALRRMTVDSTSLTWLNAPTSWPPAPGSAPGSYPGPQVLIVDDPTPPPLWIGELPWCTVMHVSTTPPAGSDFWARVDALLLTGPGYVEAVAQRWGYPDAALADDLRPGEVALADQHGILAILFPPTP
jgi:hypothetical protein